MTFKYHSIEYLNFLVVSTMQKAFICRSTY